MAMERSYKRPPITEAIIEIRLAQPLSKEAIEGGGRRLRREYVFSDPDESINLEVDVESKTSKVASAWQGVRFSSIDRTDITVFRTHAFSCSRLPPYGGWKQFRDRAARDWGLWKRSFGQRPISRIGVRYLNRIDIPIPDNVLKSIEDYLQVGPRLPDYPGLPISSYAFQVVRPLGVEECSLVLNSATVPSPLVAHASLLLDIDVYRETHLPGRDEEIWVLIDKIRDLKNQVFESCITDRARELFTQ